MGIIMKKIGVLLSITLIICLFAGCSAKAASNEEASLSSTVPSESSTAVDEAESESKKAEESASAQTGANVESSSKNANVTSGNKYQSSSGSALTTKTSATKPKATTTKPSGSNNKPNNTTAKPNPTTTKPSVTENQGGYSAEVLRCSNGGKSIYGKMYKPNKSGKMPVVILSHSFMLNSHSLVPYAELLAKNGYAAYIFDFCGGSMNNNSDGKMQDMTVFTEVSDLEAVLSKIRGLSYVDKNNVFLFGTSQGGLVSALTASKHASQIKGMILLYPGFNMAEAVKENSSMAGAVLSQKYIDAIKDYDIYGNIGGFTKDVLIIHGTADTQVPIKYSEKAVNVYSSAELVRIKGANHGFNSSNNFGMGGNFDKEVNPHILKFMESHT